MGRRETLLGYASSIEGILVGDENDWIGGHDVEVASSEGASVVTIQDGTTGPEGPFSVAADVYAKIEAALAIGDDALSDLEEQLSDESLGKGDLEFEDAVAMVQAKCKPGVEYYRLPDAEDGFEFSEDREELEREWRVGLLMAVNEWERWEDMDTEELADRLALFGIPGNDEAVEESGSEEG